MSEKFKFEVKEGKLAFAIDANADGEASIKGALSVAEGIQEVFSRGGQVEGAKLVDFSFALTKLSLKIDTDRDGEELLSIEIDLGEAFDEVKGLFEKKDA